MANNLTSNPIIVDTPSASALIPTRVEIVAIRWDAEGAGAGDNAIIQDAAGVVFWAGSAAGVNHQDSIVFPSWFPIGGLLVPTLGAGTLYIYTRPEGL